MTNAAKTVLYNFASLLFLTLVAAILVILYRAGAFTSTDLLHPLAGSATEDLTLSTSAALDNQDGS